MNKYTKYIFYNFVLLFLIHFFSKDTIQFESIYIKFKKPTFFKKIKLENIIYIENIY